ncbi:endonuclease-reverse transcriptase [Elysia marginata]|uniref:Endonuclease-reverse transcriptase n=1 Tax=Elysia marginata TaxID=1093978 RepID=A0AAV4FA43_9GAST|nr:endonuclease-reverse transcriptase [Elysia marginata]
MFNSQSRKETVRRISPPSANSLRIGSSKLRTMYEAGKTAQVVKEMHRYRLHILGISETHWNQSGQKTLSKGELLIFSSNDEGEEKEKELLDKSTQKTPRGWEA